jgi:hypothetical protein
MHTAGRTIKERDDEIHRFRMLLGEREDQINALQDELYALQGKLDEFSSSET